MVLIWRNLSSQIDLYLRPSDYLIPALISISRCRYDQFPILEFSKNNILWFCSKCSMLFEGEFREIVIFGNWRNNLSVWVFNLCQRWPIFLYVGSKIANKGIFNVFTEAMLDWTQTPCSRTSGISYLRLLNIQIQKSLGNL